MKRTAVLLITVVSLAAPGSALAVTQLAAPLPTAKPSVGGVGTTTQASLNYTSDHKALNAYATYLSALVNNRSTGDANDTAYILTISNQCKSALAPLTQPSQQVSTAVQHTLTVLGEEMGDDLAISFDQAATPAFTRFANALARLRWTRLSGWPFAVRHYVNSENAVLALSVSGLCVNASSAELRPSVVPEPTKTFVKTYSETSKQADNALTNLTRMMQSYEVPSEKALITRISNLASQVATQTRTDLLTSGSTLTTVLESN